MEVLGANSNALGLPEESEHLCFCLQITPEDAQCSEITHGEARTLHDSHHETVECGGVWKEETNIRIKEKKKENALI